MINTTANKESILSEIISRLADKEGKFDIPAMAAVTALAEKFNIDAPTMYNLCERFLTFQIEDCGDNKIHLIKALRNNCPEGDSTGLTWGRLPLKEAKEIAEGTRMLRLRTAQALYLQRVCEEQGATVNLIADS